MSTRKMGERKKKFEMFRLAKQLTLLNFLKKDYVKISGSSVK